MVLDVQFGGPRGHLGLGWGRGDEHQVLLPLAQVVGDLHLPLDEALPRVERQHHDHVLTDDGDGVGLLIESEAGFEAEEVLQRQRRLGLSLLVAVLGVAVQLEVEAICNEGSMLSFALLCFCLILLFIMPHN